MDPADSAASFARSAFALETTSSFEQQSSHEAAAAGATAAAGAAAAAREDVVSGAAAVKTAMGSEDQAAAAGAAGGRAAAVAEEGDMYAVPEAALLPIPASAFTAPEPAAPLLAGEHVISSCADTSAPQGGAAAEQRQQQQTPGTAAAAGAETAAGAATQQQHSGGAAGGGRRGGENRPVEVAPNVTKLPPFDKNINSSIFVSTSTFELTSVPPEEVTEQLLSSFSSSPRGEAAAAASPSGAAAGRSPAPAGRSPAAAAASSSMAEATSQDAAAAATTQGRDAKEEGEKQQQQQQQSEQQVQKKDQQQKEAPQQQQQDEDEANEEEPQQAATGVSKKRRSQPQDDAAGARSGGGAGGGTTATEETPAATAGAVPKKKVKTEEAERSSTDRLSRSTSLPSGAAAAAAADRASTTDEGRNRKREEEALKRELLRETESKPFKLPTCCSWFDETCISPVEEDLLPTLFTGSLLSREEREQRYLQLRQAILALYRSNPTRHLSFSDCRRAIAADAALLLRLHSFLDYWGIINFQADPSTIPSALAKRKEFLLRDFQALSQQETSPHTERDTLHHRSSRSRAAAAEELLHPAEGRGPWRCVVCGKICVYSYYVLRPACVTGVSLGVLDRCVWCLKCFAEGRFPPVLNTQQFLKVDVPVMATEEKEGGWTLAQTERLIEAIERYKDNWTEVAAYVGGGRTAQMCVERFIQLPIKEPFSVPSSSTLGVTSNRDSNVNHTSGRLTFQRGEAPFAGHGNPLLSLLAFLASSVHPSVAAAAAKAALERAVEVGTLPGPAAAAGGARAAAAAAHPTAAGWSGRAAAADEAAAAAGERRDVNAAAAAEEEEKGTDGERGAAAQQAGAAAADLLHAGAAKKSSKDAEGGGEEDAVSLQRAAGPAGDAAATAKRKALTSDSSTAAASAASATRQEGEKQQQQQQQASLWGSGGGLVADRDLEAASSTALAAGAASAAELALVEEAEAEKLLRDVVQLQLQQLECKMNCMRIIEKRIARSKANLEKNFRALLLEHQDAAAELERTKALAAAATAASPAVPAQAAAAASGTSL